MRDDIITKIGTQLRTVLPDEAAEITLNGEADENYARVSLGMRRADGTAFHFGRDDDPREVSHEISDLLIDLWEAAEDDGDDPWHGITLTVRRDGTSEVAFSADFPEDDEHEPAGPGDAALSEAAPPEVGEDDEPLPEPEELITELAELLRDILPDDATEIVLDGEVDEEWSSHSITLLRADGTSYRFGSGDAPESTQDVADILNDLWDSTIEYGEEPWYGITMTVRRDDTFEVTFSEQPPEE